MQKLVKEYLNELNRRQRKRRKANIAVMLLVVIVFGGVVGILTQYGVAMTEEAKCGMEEHQHVEECYQDVLICGREESEGHQHVEECHQTENVLVCGQEEHEGHAHVEECYQEDGTLVCGMEESEGHQHGEACYESRSNLVCGMEESEEHAHTVDCHERQLVCGKEEHAHTEVCRIDLSADVEDASKWDAQYANVSWSGNWGEDLATAAQKQLGYKESMNNYQIAENGSHKGYTRYGQFMGDVYADWDAAFVNFCLHYARLANTGMFTNEKDSGSWHGRIANGANAGYLITADGYEPKVGDIVFFHRSGEETSTQMGIVSSYDNGSNEIKVIEGNSGNEVRENRYAANDGHIFAYLKVTEMERAYKHIGEDAVGTESTEPGEDANENPGTEGADGVNPEVEDADGEDSTNLGVEDTDGEENADSSDEDGENVELGTENKEAGTENGDLEAEGGNDMNAEEEEEIPAAVVEELEKSPAYEASYEDDMGTIHVAAGAGTIPEGAELSVKKIEPVMTTADLNDEEVVDAREINDQYELTAKKLLEESEKNNTTLEGFLAYDISFLVDGVEVEPNGPVKVTMDFNEAVKPEGVSENATVAVNHLKEDATAEDGVVVEDLTEKAATTITTKEEEVAVEKVELVTGSFSTFVISWQLGGYPFGTLSVECVDQNGNVIEGLELLEEDVSLAFQEGKEWDLWDLIGVAEITKNGITYTPQEIQLGLRNSEEEWSGDEVRKVEAKEGSYHFYASDGSEAQVISYFEFGDNYCLHVVFEAPETGTLGINIVDNIMKEGRLEASLNLPEDLQEIYEQAREDGKAIKYVWLKSVNNGEFVQSKPKQYDNGQYNVDETVDENIAENANERGGWVNVALDGGALNDTQRTVTYKVELWIGEEPVAISKPFEITYYSEGQNGSFEKPVVENKNASDPPYMQKNQNEIEGWKTTSVAGEIEIAWSRNGYINSQYYGRDSGWTTVHADEGEQFAELNAEGVGALYQDVLSIRGTVLHYSFAHRARPMSNNAKDHMYLLIVPTWVAEKGIPSNERASNDYTVEIDTLTEVEWLKRHKNDVDANGNLLYPDVYVQDYVAGPREWVTHTGDYMPEYNLNRFFFVSAEEYTPTMGNFIDDVHFSQYLPAPEKGKFSFRINKTIVGLDDAAVEQLKTKLEFEITIIDKSSGKPIDIAEIPATLKATDERMKWEKSGFDGSWFGIATFDNIEIGENTYTISVTEKNADMDSYQLDASVTVITSKEETVSDDGQSTVGTMGTVDVSENVSRGLRFTNAYSQNINYAWEVVKCSSSDPTKKVDGAVFALKKGEETVATGTSREEDGIVEWTWADGMDETKLDGEYILSETSAPGGYVATTETMTLTFKGGKLEPISNPSEGSHINVTLDQANYKYTILVKNDVEFYELPSTGGAGIYLYMFGGVLLMAAAALITYRNKRREVLRS